MEYLQQQQHRYELNTSVEHMRQYSEQQLCTNQMHPNQMMPSQSPTDLGANVSGMNLAQQRMNYGQNYGPNTGNNVMMVPPHPGVQQGYMPDGTPMMDYPAGLMEPPKPPAKKRRKKKKQAGPPIGVSVLLDRSGMPCPNVDVRQMAPNAPPGYDHQQKSTSFMENPTGFISQQMAMVGHKLYTAGTPEAALSPTSSCSSHGAVSPVRGPEQHSPSGVMHAKQSNSPAMHAKMAATQQNNSQGGYHYSPNSGTHSPYGMQHSPVIGSTHMGTTSPHMQYHPGINQQGYNVSPSQMSPGGHLHHRPGKNIAILLACPDGKLI